MKCPRCKKIFYESEVLRRHIRMFHGIRDGEVIVCTENNCFQIFTKVFNFIRHCKICHNISNVHKDSLLTNNLRTETACVEESVDSIDSSIHSVQSYDNDNIVENSIKKVTNIAAQHCIDLLAQPNITVTTAVSNIEKTSDLMSHCILYLKQRMKDAFLRNILAEEHNNLLQEFDILSKVLEPYSTVSKLENVAKNWSNYVASIEVELGLRYENRYKLGINHITPVKETFQQIPLKKLLIKFFTCNGVLKTVMQYRQRAKGEINEMINIQQGAYYRNHEILSTDDNVIALKFYIDDVEITNPLSSKPGIHKIGLIYFTIKDLPLTHMSSLDNIFFL